MVPVSGVDLTFTCASSLHSWMWVTSGGPATGESTLACPGSWWRGGVNGGKLSSDRFSAVSDEAPVVAVPIGVT